jgi:hypothetical protein
MFSDWNTKFMKPDSGNDIANDNVNIRLYDTVRTDALSSFYLKVEGTILAGATIPMTRAMSMPSSSGTIPAGGASASGTQTERPLPVDVAEDTIYIFLDTGAGGYQIPGLSFRANEMIEIRGQNGDIISARYLRFASEDQYDWIWEPVEGIEVDAANDARQIEVQAGTSPLNVYFHVVDWDDNTDASDSPITFDDNGVVVEGNRADGDWWDTDWTYRKKLTIDSAGGKVDSTLTNFPVLVKIDGTGDIDFANVASSLGNDIRFTNLGGTQTYDYEIERWNEGSNLAEIWVEIPSISSSADTEFYIYYGNSGASAGESPTAVWDSNYEMVQHLHETTRTTGDDNDHLDSTSNNHDAEALFGTDMTATGEIDGADEFDGINDRVDCGSDAGLLPTYITIEAWINRDATGSTEAIVSKGLSTKDDDVPYLFRVLSTNKLMFGTYDYSGSSWNQVQSTATLSASTWYYVAAQYDGARLEVFINGNAPENSSYTGGLLGTGEEVLIGNRLWVDTQDFDGIIDEVRISSSARSDDWIETSYYSGDDNLISYGTEEVDTWWNSNWDHRMKLTIDQTKVDSTLTNFPIAVFLDSTNFDFDKARSDGRDIRFVAPDGTTVFDYEIEYWNKASTDAQVWVEVPSVSSSGDTSFYMYHGNNAATAGQSPTAVWESDFMMVQHLHETSKTTGSFNDHLDSTSNNNDAEALFGVDMAATGQIDGADDFDGDNDKVDCNNDSSLLPTHITIEAWINRDNAGVTEAVVSKGVSSKDDSIPYMFRVLSNNSLMFGTYNYTASSWNDIASSTTLSASTWYYIAATYDGSSLSVYIDDGAANSVSYSGGLLGTGEEVLIGDRLWVDTQTFEGVIDEVRISDSARSAAWIKASYHSGVDTGADALLSYGFEEIEGIPAYNDSGWVNAGIEQLEAEPDPIDIINDAVNGTEYLQYQTDGNFIYFQFFTQVDPDMDGYTYSILLDDGGEGTYDYCIATYGATDSVRLYKWSAVNGWDNTDVKTLGSGYYKFDGVQDVVQLAVDVDDTFVVAAADKAYAATYANQSDAFEEGRAWESTNNPIPDWRTVGDYTTASLIPEFSVFMIPAGSVVLFYLVFRRRRRLYAV